MTSNLGASTQLTLKPTSQNLWHLEYKSPNSPPTTRTIPEAHAQRLWSNIRDAADTPTSKIAIGDHCCYRLKVETDQGEYQIHNLRIYHRHHSHIHPRASG